MPDLLYSYEELAALASNLTDDLSVLTDDPLVATDAQDPNHRYDNTTYANDDLHVLTDDPVVKTDALVGWINELIKELIVSPFINTVNPAIAFDPTIRALASVADEAGKRMVPLIDRIAILTNLPNASDAALDQLAEDFGIDFYDTSFSRDAKLYLIQNNLDIKSRIGTAGIIEEVITKVFVTARVFEWFESGLPHHVFVVATTDTVSDPLVLQQMKRTINYLKNQSSVFAGFDITQSVGSTVTVTTSVRMEITETIPLPTDYYYNITLPVSVYAVVRNEVVESIGVDPALAN